MYYNVVCRIYYKITKADMLFYLFPISRYHEILHKLNNIAIDNSVTAVNPINRIDFTMSDRMPLLLRQLRIYGAFKEIGAIDTASPTH